MRAATAAAAAAARLPLPLLLLLLLLGCVLALGAARGARAQAADGADAFELAVVGVLQPHWDALTQRALAACGGDELCVEGHISMLQAGEYARFAASPLVGSVCEIGFNAGHSTAVWLAANPDAHVLSFDRFDKPYSQAALAYLQDTFGAHRISVAQGDSVETVPQVAATLGAPAEFTCDVIVVDGGHRGIEPRLDMINMRAFAHCDTLLLVDDTFTIARVAAQYHALVAEGVLKHVRAMQHKLHFSDGTVHRGFAVAQYAIDACERRAAPDANPHAHHMFRELSLNPSLDVAALS